MTSAPAGDAGGATTTEARGGTVLPLVHQLATALEGAGVTYCHWKSNAALERSLSGDNDLDLLVQRSDLVRFTAVVSELGFARAYKPGSEVAGIESFYGFDSEADRWVHVHAHSQLVLGDDRTKNYRLPIEAAYLRSATRARLLPVPAPELEYVVFVIRMTLKYCTWDEIVWRAARGRRAAPKPSERAEFEHLRSLADAGRVYAVLQEHVPYVSGEVFAECEATLLADLPARRRIRTGRRLEVALQPHGRRSRRADRALRISGRVGVALKRRARGVPGNRLAAGGAMVGIVGGDGAGKSTALAALDGWLGSVFDVRLVHLGKPDWSATTYGVRATLKAASVGADGLVRLLPVPPVRRVAGTISAYRPLVWLLCTARDRHHAYGEARRFANDGGIVLCDRYPHARLRTMEVPLIASRRADGLDGRLVRAMIRLEQRYHRSIVAPELLVVLRLDPEIAVARKTDERPDTVRARGAEIWSIDWKATGAREIDASRPPEVVARDLKALVWSTIG